MIIRINGQYTKKKGKSILCYSDTLIFSFCRRMLFRSVFFFSSLSIRNITGSFDDITSTDTCMERKRNTSITNMSNLLQLPVELLYRILDNLDELTILLSMRNVCIRLNAITDTYHRYQVYCSFIFADKIIRIFRSSLL